MFCYSCMETDRSVHAVAVCRWCGGATCQDHTREVRSAPALTPLMAPALPPRRELVCQCCWEEQSQVRAAMARPSRRRREARAEEKAALPDGVEAVRLAETFLLGERSKRRSLLFHYALLLLWHRMRSATQAGRAIAGTYLRRWQMAQRHSGSKMAEDDLQQGQAP